MREDPGALIAQTSRGKMLGSLTLIASVRIFLFLSCRPLSPFQLPRIRSSRRLPSTRWLRVLACIYGDRWQSDVWLE